MSKDISKEFRAEVRKRAQRSPNFVYKAPDGERCVYVNPKNGAGSCIIGRGALAVGASRESLKAFDNDGYGISADVALPGAFPEDDKFIDPETISWARKIQSHQDRKVPWRKAVQMADAYYGDIAREDGVNP